MTRAYVGLGANLGPREDTLREAVGILGRADGIEVVAISTLRETEPVGPVEQPMFLNGAVELETTLSARELLDLLLDAERALGRIRAEALGAARRRSRPARVRRGGDPRAGPRGTAPPAPGAAIRAGATRRAGTRARHPWPGARLDLLAELD